MRPRRISSRARFLRLSCRLEGKNFGNMAKDWHWQRWRGKEI
jgi:hypothetical protein